MLCFLRHVHKLCCSCRFSFTQIFVVSFLATPFYVMLLFRIFISSSRIACLRMRASSNGWCYVVHIQIQSINRCMHALLITSGNLQCSSRQTQNNTHVLYLYGDFPFTYVVFILNQWYILPLNRNLSPKHSHQKAFCIFWLIKTSNII